MNRAPDGVRYRRATESDLAACARIWRDGLNGYFEGLGLPPVPEENPAVGRLHRHTLASDPELFVVATRGGAAPATEEVVGFASAIERGPVWFLSMLFVDPAEQARGVGRALLERVLSPSRARGPAADGGTILATATDAAQPISNGLYGSVGMAPRVALLSLIGRPRPDAGLPGLPPGITATSVSGDAVGDPSPGGDRALAAEIDALDTATLGFAHPVDHAFVRREGRRLFTYRDAAGELVGYGYTSEVGRIAPVAVRDASLMAPVVAHLLTVVEPRGASAIWTPGDAGETLATLLRAGLRIDGFPVLVLWSRPFADFARYVPISPGLL
jgi:GNAT superfamily N-acetyltransferase